MRSFTKKCRVCLWASADWENDLETKGAEAHVSTDLL